MKGMSENLDPKRFKPLSHTYYYYTNLLVVIIQNIAKTMFENQISQLFQFKEHNHCSNTVFSICSFFIVYFAFQKSITFNSHYMIVSFMSYCFIMCLWFWNYCYYLTHSVFLFSLFSLFRFNYSYYVCFVWLFCMVYGYWKFRNLNLFICKKRSLH